MLFSWCRSKESTRSPQLLPSRTLHWIHWPACLFLHSVGLHYDSLTNGKGHLQGAFRRLKYCAITPCGYTTMCKEPELSCLNCSTLPGLYPSPILKIPWSSLGKIEAHDLTCPAFNKKHSAAKAKHFTSRWFQRENRTCLKTIIGTTLLHLD